MSLHSFPWMVSLCWRELLGVAMRTRVVGIQGTGHFVMLEKADEFNKLLSDFLATVKF